MKVASVCVECYINSAKAAGGRECMGLVGAVFMVVTRVTSMETLANRIMARWVPDSIQPIRIMCTTRWVFSKLVVRVGRNGRTVRVLVNAQRRDGCFDGSWDWEGTKFHGYKVGR